MTNRLDPRALFHDAGLRFADYYKSLVKENKAVTETLQEELENILSALVIYQHENGWSEVSSLTNSLDIFLDGKGYWNVLHYWLENVLTNSNSVDDIPVLIGNILSLAHLYSNQGERDKAIETYDQGINLAKEQNDFQHLAQAYYGLGSVFFATGEVETARENWQRALKYANDCNDGVQIAIIKYYLTLSDKNIEEEANAVSRLQQATSFATGIFSKLGKEGIPFNTVLRANTFLQMGKYQEARGLFLEALEYFNHGDEKQGEALILYNLGLIAQQQENFTQALQYYHRSLVIAEALKDRTGLILLNSSIGMLHLQTQRYDLARPFLEGGNRLLREDADNKRLADNLYWLGYAFANTGDLGLAEQAFEESKFLFSKFDSAKVKDVDNVLLKVRELINKPAD